MKDVITTLIIMLACITALAQQGVAEDTINQQPESKSKQIKQTKANEKSTTKYTAMADFAPPASVQVFGGSQGVGADVKYGFLPKWSGRLGFGIIPATVSRDFGFSGFQVAGQLASRFSNVHLLADYSPFEKLNLRLVGGAAYLVRGDADGTITPSGNYSLGSQSITSQQLGVLHADVTWKGVAPYLGISVFQGFPNRLFNINLDLGTYYLSSPGTSFTGTKLLSDNDANAQQFKQNMQGYRWLPVVQLNFNFRIK